MIDRNGSYTESTLVEVKKSVDRLALIELCKSGATTAQIRDIFGSIDNNLISKIRKALRNKNSDLNKDQSRGE